MAAWPQRDLPPSVGEFPIIFPVVVVGGVNAAETTHSAVGPGLDAFAAEFKTGVICPSVAGKEMLPTEGDTAAGITACGGHMCGNVVPGTLIGKPSVLGASPGCGISVARNALVDSKGFAFCEVSEIDADSVDLWPDACGGIPNGKVHRWLRELSKPRVGKRSTQGLEAIVGGRRCRWEDEVG